jgi:hypothetical protein
MCRLFLCVYDYSIKILKNSDGSEFVNFVITLIGRFLFCILFILTVGTEALLVISLRKKLIAIVKEEIDSDTLSCSLSYTSMSLIGVLLFFFLFQFNFNFNSIDVITSTDECFSIMYNLYCIHCSYQYYGQRYNYQTGTLEGAH